MSFNPLACLNKHAKKDVKFICGVALVLLALYFYFVHFLTAFFLVFCTKRSREGGREINKWIKQNNMRLKQFAATLDYVWTLGHLGNKPQNMPCTFETKEPLTVGIKKNLSKHIEMLLSMLSRVFFTVIQLWNRIR